MKAKLLVSNLDRSTTEDELDLLFSQYAEINYIDLNEFPDKGKTTLSAIVSINDENDAEYAIEKLQGKKLKGRQIKIEWMESDEWDDEYDEDEYSNGDSYDDVNDDAYDDSYEDEEMDDEDYDESYDDMDEDTYKESMLE